MEERQRVDWRVVDAPSCGDCVHCQMDDWYLAPKHYQPENALRFAKCDVLLYDNEHYCSTQRDSEGAGCGASARFFERKPREVGEYDFENDPPIMGWMS